MVAKEEKEVLDALGDVWNKFLDLPPLHPQDRNEFMQAIHSCQNIVLARVGMRVIESVQDDAKEVTFCWICRGTGRTLDPRRVGRVLDCRGCNGSGLQEHEKHD